MIKLPRRTRKASPVDVVATMDALTVSLLSGTDARIRSGK